jgi:hypothetical protein
MPLVIEEDHRLLTGFDPQTASTLFWKDIPVVLRQPDREDQHEKLTFRILSGSTRQNHSLRVSRGMPHMPGWHRAMCLSPPHYTLQLTHGVLPSAAHRLQRIRHTNLWSSSCTSSFPEQLLSLTSHRTGHPHAS